MTGARRFAIAVWAIGLLLAPAGAFAQDATPPADRPPATDAVGPRELQNFSLSGTVTRSADQPPPTTAAKPPAQTTSESTTPARRASERNDAPRAEIAKRSSATAQTAQLSAPPQLQPTVPAPLGTEATPPAPQPAPSPAAAAFTPPPDRATGTLAPAGGFPLMPWLLAASLLAAAGVFLFWRNRSRHAVAGGPHLDLFSPEPQPAPAPRPPAPRPAPAPPPQPRAADPAPAPTPSGIVSTTLRPWMEVSVQPLRCILNDDNVTVEFELDLFNSGSAPARDVHVAAALINAGETQEQALASFFAQAPGPGDRIDVIQPLKRVTFTTQIVTSREMIRPLDMGGRLVFVPVIAFNATYGWGSKKGQTSVSYLLGREGKTDKLGPFRLDLGPRLFRGLGARPLPIGVRS